MSFSRKTLSEEIKEWFIRIDRSIEGDKALKFQDSSIVIEDFFLRLLNLIYEWQLKNANTPKSSSQDSFDLYDDVNKIAVQVTRTIGAAKVKKTLRSFIGVHDKKYTQLFFVYPSMSRPAGRVKLEKLLNGYHFDYAKNRLSLSCLLGEIAKCDVPKMEVILELLRVELKPLGRTLQMGVDQTVETVIKVIEHMSKFESESPIVDSELKPDQVEKLRRFEKYAQFLLNEYQLNIASYSHPKSVAKETVGYDSARVVKIQSWLKSKSLKALSDHQGNAEQAFEGLVKQLLSDIHAAGREAENQAVAFFLADEFLRCNVFPNPPKLPF